MDVVVKTPPVVFLTRQELSVFIHNKKSSQFFSE